jgi:phosphoribosyl 1,2-cyclic phosphodiesterase
MLVKFWGARGSLPSPGAEMVRYGGNTSCVQVTLSDGTQLVLDAGSGIRNLPADLGTSGDRIHILLTHLHLDHIQGLLFFPPLFRPEAKITLWGPASPGLSLQRRIGRYLSAPLTPVEVRELPCQLDFRNCPVTRWSIGPARITAEGVTHRGPTLGFRVEDGGASLCYLPDHEPAIVGEIDQLEPEWLSGSALARDTDLLLHDCQYTDSEYPGHLGWGHSSVSHALKFARRVAARQTLLFHHDPFHTDDHLDSILEGARAAWRALGRGEEEITMATEGLEVEVPTRTASPEDIEAPTRPAG